MSEQRLMKCETIDDDENAFFSKVSPIWWDMSLQFSTMHKVGAVTYKYIREIFAFNGVKEDENVEIIDVGCGGGIISEAIARHGYTVTGIDVNEDLIKVAKEHSALDKTLTNLTYYHTSANRQAYRDPEKYDVVILAYVLQHVKKHEILLRDCVKLLKPGGLIFIAAIEKTFKSWIILRIILERIKRIFPIGAHKWRNFIKRSAVENILEKYGCTIINRSGVRYNDIEWEACKNIDALYILCARKNHN
ncbi:hypothetical protein FQR65_LT10816 [Abscondita terminalis]|nr:hypothetical protein FQR65_LT10816 [Abscondita terminalis]